jgi:hypothetical protein
MRRDTFARYNVLASFDGMEKAKDAVAALEGASVEGDDISLLGKAAEEAAEETDRGSAMPH